MISSASLIAIYRSNVWVSLMITFHSSSSQLAQRSSSWLQPLNGV